MVTFRETLEMNEYRKINRRKQLCVIFLFYRFIIHSVAENRSNSNRFQWFVTRNQVHTIRCESPRLHFAKRSAPRIISIFTDMHMLVIEAFRSVIEIFFPFYGHNPALPSDFTQQSSGSNVTAKNLLQFQAN